MTTRGGRERYEDEELEDDGYEPEERDEQPYRRRELHASEAARSAAEHIVELTGRQPSAVISLHLGDDGWVAEVEVVEDRRIPSSEDILALYRIELDDDGEPLGYHRLRRYPRGRGDREGRQ